MGLCSIAQTILADNVTFLKITQKTSLVKHPSERVTVTYMVQG